MTGTTIATLAERALRRLGVTVVPEADRPAAAVIVALPDLATRALVVLAVIASDETPSATDQALAVSKVQAVHDAMVLAGFVQWDINSVPQGVSEEYVLLAALHLAAAFGKTGDPAQIALLEGRVRKAAMIMRAVPLAEQAVLSAHQDLAMRGKVRWSVFDIPPAVEDVYTFLGAYQLAPLFGMQPDDKDAAQAELALARYIALPTSGERTPAEYF